MGLHKDCLNHDISRPLQDEGGRVQEAAQDNLTGHQDECSKWKSIVSAHGGSPRLHRPAIALIGYVWFAQQPFLGLARPGCAIRIVNGNGWTEADFDHLHASGLFDEPVLITNTVDWWHDGVASKESIMEHFGGYPLHVAVNLEMQSATGWKGKDRLITTVGDWINSLGNINTTNYTFSWLNFYASPEFNQKFLDRYPVPQVLQRSVRTMFFTMGSQSAGIRLHSHSGSSWVALLAGKKQWYLAAPSGPGTDDAIKFREQEEFENANFLSCTQNASDVLYLPSSWQHATFDIDPWTVGIGSQAPNGAVTLLDYAATVGNTKLLDGVDQAGLAASENVIQAAVEAGHARVTELLLKKRGTQANTEGLINQAMQLGHIDILDILLAKGTPIPESIQGMAAFYYANPEKYQGRLDTSQVNAAFGRVVRSKVDL